jgi:hypothetical protein
LVKTMRGRGAAGTRTDERRALAAPRRALRHDASAATRRRAARRPARPLARRRVIAAPPPRDGRSGRAGRASGCAARRAAC